MEYILSEKQKGCVFCDALDKPDGVENLVIHRSEHSFVILNRYPYTSGHLMIVPYIHKPNLEELSTAIRSEIIELSTCATRVLKSVYQPQGFNLGVNVGEVAGAGIQDHVHLHVVPRWSGDTNFMSALSSTRLLPELLQDTYIRVKEGWERNA
jgi:ATP adenylyltransferase